MSRITGSEVKNLMEAYADVHEQQEIIDEQESVLGKIGPDWYEITKDASGKTTGKKKLDPSEVGSKARRRYERLRSQDWHSKIGQEDPAKISREAEAERKAQLARASGKREPGFTPTPPSDGGETRRPPATPVLSKKDGVEGSGVGKDFKARAWSDAERQRYTSAAQTASVRQPAPQASPVAKYMDAAAAARKSGDPAQMSAVRDQGLAIWRDKYKDTLAKKVSPTGQQLGTGQSVMAKQADELRALRPVKTPEAPVNTSVTTTAAPAPKPTVKTDTAAQRAQEAQKPIPPTVSSTVKPFNSTKIENSKRGTSTGIVASSYEYDAYDLVLEYLISNGHADTLGEANYVMMQMSSEHIQDIVESPGEWFRGIFNPNNSAASRAQNTSPFSRPTAPLPSYTSPFAKPASRTDSGKLTTYGAGGGAEAERRGQTRDEVMRQGAKNLENKNKPQANPGPNFGR